MRILCIDPGADFSTADVYRGLIDGLRANDHTVIEYRYGRRLGVMHRALDLAWKEQRKAMPDVAKPTDADAALWTSELAVTWAIRHAPLDLVIVVSGMFVHPDALIMLRRCGFPVALLCTETPYSLHHEQRFASLVDFVFTNERTAIPTFRQVNPHSYYLPHAYHPEIHNPDFAVDANVPSHDVVFVGTGFQERVDWLMRVDWTGIDLGLYGAWNMIPPRAKLRRCIQRGIVDNTYTSALYRKAKIGLNLFRQSLRYERDGERITTAESLNPRSYELAACGCFHISDARAEVGEVFGELVPQFSTGKELDALVHAWLANDLGRSSVARALPVAIADHSWVTRAAQLIATVQGARQGQRDAVA